MKELETWQEKLYGKEATDVQMFIDTWIESAFSLIPADKRKGIFRHLDRWLLYVHTFIGQSSMQEEAKRRLIVSAKIFDEQIETIGDVKKLPLHYRAYLAEQQVAKHRLQSLVQGGVSGTGGLLFLGADIPAMLAINIKAIQLIGMTYGYEMNTPYEMVVALKLFHGATLPSHLQQDIWSELMEQVRANRGEPQLFYEGEDDILDVAWLRQPIKQGIKAAMIYRMRKKLVQGIPLVGMAIGAVSNYQLTKEVTEYAHQFYQARCLIEEGRV